MTPFKERRHNDPYLAIFEDAPIAIWVEDFSAIKCYLDQLRASGISDFETYLAENPDALLECLSRLRVLHVNRLARKFYGAPTPDELIQTLPDLFDDRSLSTFADELVALWNGDTLYEAEFVTPTLTGEQRLVQMNVSILPTPEHPWSRVVVAFTDLTERRRLEEELLQSQKLESLGRLAGGVAHDLNNALTIIAGYSDMLLSDLGPDNPAYTELDEIRKAGERAAALTRQLLVFSRKQILEPKLINLNTIVTEATPVLKTASGDHIQVVIELDPGLGWTRVDPTQFYHVLLNLVLNARDAMPEGGTVEIRTANRRMDSVSAGKAGVRPGAYVALSVSDTGIGMDEDTRRQAFDPFFTTKSVGKGTGLGLSSAFGIVKQSGGSIVALSRAGSGSEFVVFLPAVQGREDASTGASEVDSHDLKGRETILVVEDEADVRGLLAGTLKRYGYTVLEGPDPAEALALFTQHHTGIDLVITDIVMPGMTGTELVNRMREIASELKVLYISGYANVRETSVHSADSRTAYLQKPFGMNALAGKVRDVLGSRPVRRL